MSINRSQPPLTPPPGDGKDRSKTNKASPALPSGAGRSSEGSRHAEIPPGGGKGYVKTKSLRPGFWEKKVIPFYQDRAILINAVLGITFGLVLFALIFWAIRSPESSGPEVVEQQPEWLVEPINADVLLDAFARANFGAGGVDGLQSVSISGAITIGDEPKSFHMLKKRPDLALLKIEVSEQVVATYGINSEMVWLRTGAVGREESTRILEGQEEENFRVVGEFFTPLADLASLPRPRAGKVLSVSFAEGSDKALIELEYQGVDMRHISFITADDLREVRRVDFLQDMEVRETTFEDYRASEGIHFPFLTQVMRGGELVQKTVLEKVKVNPGVISSLFEGPSDL
jgi:hypothetical protein